MGAVVDAISRHLKKGGRGITFSKEIEDQIDPEKKKEREADATGERVKRGFESQREGAGAVREEMERQKKKPKSSAGWIRG